MTLYLLLSLPKLAYCEFSSLNKYVFFMGITGARCMGYIFEDSRNSTSP